MKAEMISSEVQTNIDEKEKDWITSTYELDSKQGCVRKKILRARENPKI